MTASDDGLSARARQLWTDAIVIDAHNDLASRILNDGYDPDERHRPGFAGDEGETDIPRLVESGVTGQFFSAFVDGSYARKVPDESYARAIAQIDAIHAVVSRNPTKLTFATTPDDVRRAKREGKIAVFIGVEGGHAIENSLDKLRELHRRGARYLTLTWNNGNDWAGSSVGEHGSRTGGLTGLGVEVVHELNRLGMLVDVSHVSDATFFDVVAASEAPVIASHSNARAIADVSRNLSDEQLRAIGDMGGVVNVNCFAAFVDGAFFAERMRLEETFAGQDARIAELARLIPRPPLSALINHIDHIVSVAGIDHVGLGSDFDGVGGLLPVGLNDVTHLPRIVDALVARHYADDDIRKILGENMLRVMEAVA